MRGRAVSALLLVSGLSACGGPQSILDPAGRDAEVLATLFWIMFIGAVILWLAMNGMFLTVTRFIKREMSERKAEALIIGGGIVFPTVVLAGLLTYALTEMPRQRERGEGLTVRVVGESWWWRVEYLPDGASEPVVSANEIRLPVGSRTEIELAANGVIHAFWIP
ncbi:cytochrome B, partial [Cribrihabitans sp. XS_ASV171]